MAHAYKDVPTCAEHGFALSPDGQCLRCSYEATRAARRRAGWKQVGVASAGLGLLALVAMWGHERTADGATRRDDRVAVVSLGDRVGERGHVGTGAPPAARPPGALASVQGPAPSETRALLDQWNAELARANAAEAAKAWRDARVPLTVTGAPVATRSPTKRVATQQPPHPVHAAAQVSSPVGSEDHPEWWQDRTPTPRRSFACAARRRAAALAAAAQAAQAGQTPPFITE